MILTCRINGRRLSLDGHPMARLLDVLRAAGFTGTKEGCGEGECGACRAVMLDGALVNSSCLTPLAHADEASIMTIEGVAADEGLHQIQQSFLECGGAQCGICTPGMVLAARGSAGAQRRSHRRRRPRRARRQSVPLHRLHAHLRGRILDAVRSRA